MLKDVCYVKGIQYICKIYFSIGFASSSGDIQTLIDKIISQDHTITKTKSESEESEAFDFDFQNY